MHTLEWNNEQKTFIRIQLLFTLDDFFREMLSQIGDALILLGSYFFYILIAKKRALKVLDEKFLSTLTRPVSI